MYQVENGVSALTSITASTISAACSSFIAVVRLLEWGLVCSNNKIIIVRRFQKPVELRHTKKTSLLPLRSISLPPPLGKHRSSIMKLLVLLICLVIGETSCARLRRIVGGQEIEITKVPYQVSLRYNDYHICGGTLITGRHVLTAAHCVADLFEEPYNDLTVVTGTESLKSGGDKHSVQSVKWHDGFVDGLETHWINDIAVLTLTESVAQNGKQKAILLPAKETPTNVDGIISGFGRTRTHEAYPSSTLHGATTKILSSTECNKIVNNHKILDTQICGKMPKGIGVCKGDSGGPLAFNGTIVGIASWNQPCALGIPDVYTNVYHYLDFIKQIVKGSDNDVTTN